MPSETLLLFVPACFALNMAFGPNNLLSITIGAQHGLRASLLAAIGRLVAFAIMIAVAGIALYAYAGTRLSVLMCSERCLRWVNRISGGTMITFGVLLAVARRPAA